MPTSRLRALHTALGWLACAWCLCAVAALVDGMTADTGSSGTLAVVAGETLPVSGPLPAGTTDATALVVAAARPDVRLRVIRIFAGYWFGNPMWRGELQASPVAQPGTGRLVLETGHGPAQILHIRVFASPADRNAASPSVIRRLLGRSPLAMAGVFASAGIALGTGLFFLGRKLDLLWQAQGKAVITRVADAPDGRRIAFGLGTRQGLAPGDTIRIYDAAGRPVAQGTVVGCTQDAAEAHLDGSTPVLPGRMLAQLVAAKGGGN